MCFNFNLFCSVYQAQEDWVVQCIMPQWLVLLLDLQASTLTALVALATATQTSLALPLPQMMKYDPSLAARQVDTFQQLCCLLYFSINIIDTSSQFTYISKCILLVLLRHVLIAPAGCDLLYSLLCINSSLTLCMHQIADLADQHFPMLQVNLQLTSKTNFSWNILCT